MPADKSDKQTGFYKLIMKTYASMPKCFVFQSATHILCHSCECLKLKMLLHLMLHFATSTLFLTVFPGIITGLLEKGNYIIIIRSLLIITILNN